MKTVSNSCMKVNENNFMRVPGQTGIQEINPINKIIYRANTILVLLLVILSFGCFDLHSQNFPIYPIPSYNTAVDGYADFMNIHSSPQQNNKDRRQLIVHMKSANGPNQPCQATIWVYCLDLTTILGPYSLACGETLSVPIDERQWGVMVESTDKVIVDVWIEEGGSKSIQGMLPDSDPHSFPLCKVDECFANFTR
jgi:hypothetical protein